MKFVDDDDDDLGKHKLLGCTKCLGTCGSATDHAGELPHTLNC